MSRLAADVRASAAAAAGRPRHLSDGRRSGRRSLGRAARGRGARRCRRARGRRAVLGSARRRPGDPARQRARARRRHVAARRARGRPARARRGRHADRPLHLRQSRRPHGRRRSSRGRRRTPASTACSSSTIRSRRPNRCARRCVDAGLDPIFLISPTTSEERIRKSAALGARVPVRDLPAWRHRASGTSCPRTSDG